MFPSFGAPFSLYADLYTGCTDVYSVIDTTCLLAVAWGWCAEQQSCDVTLIGALFFFLFFSLHIPRKGCLQCYVQSCRSPLSTGLGYMHSCCVSVCMVVGEGGLSVGGVFVYVWGGGGACICIVCVCGGGGCVHMYSVCVCGGGACICIVCVGGVRAYVCVGGACIVCVWGGCVHMYSVCVCVGGGVRAYV